MTKCKDGCGQDVVIKTHEGTNKKLFYNIGGEVLHRCEGKEYYCKDCKKKIPERKPCHHKLLNFPGYKKRGLDHHF